MITLKDICERKHEDLMRIKAEAPLDAVIEAAQNMPPATGFIEAIRNHPGTAVIAEVKKASPSRGVIREDFDPLAIAQSYHKAGAACLSILTEEPYFQGNNRYLKNIKANVALPALRKDFMLEPYQIYESRALGADCVLLIVAALKDKDLLELYDIATALEMDVLVEVHDDEELQRALRLDPKMIGVNNRDLKTMAVDIETSLQLIQSIPDEILKISESGISEPGSILTLKKAGYDGFLIGESLMKQPDPGAALKQLL